MSGELDSREDIAVLMAAHLIIEQLHTLYESGYDAGLQHAGSGKRIISLQE